MRTLKAEIRLQMANPKKTKNFIYKINIVQVYIFLYSLEMRDRENVFNITATARIARFAIFLRKLEKIPFNQTTTKSEHKDYNHRMV